MAEERAVRRTVLPPGEAEGAGNFAAEPGMDPTAGAPDFDRSAATAMETGVAGQTENPSPAGEEGNRTGGEPVEQILERRAESEERLARMEQTLDEANDR